MPGRSFLWGIEATPGDTDSRSIATPPTALPPGAGRGQSTPRSEGEQMAPSLRSSAARRSLPVVPRSRRARSSSQLGQALPLVVVFMFTILIFAGLVIDLGNAYRVQRALQASADAAAAGGA